MKKLILFIALVLCGISANAQQTSAADETPMMQVYCEVACIQYHLLKADVNAMVDFGIADTAIHADGWIYNPQTNKKYSFASPMSVVAYMGRFGWEYKDAIVGSEDGQKVWHFILTKRVPAPATPSSIIGGIDYRQ